MEHIIVIGAGPLGRAVTRSLVEAEHHVTVATHSGTQLLGAQTARADVVTGDSLKALAPGASIVACCGITYTIAGWHRNWLPAIDNLIGTTERQSATLVITGNYYSYVRGRMPMRATDPLGRPPSALGEVRAEVSCRLFVAYEQGRIRAVEVRGSSYFGADAGPGVYLGPRFVDPLLAKGATSALGGPDLPYTMTAIPDFGRLLACAATDPKMPDRAWRVPSAPAVSVCELAQMLLRAAGCGDEPRLHNMPASLLRVLGWFSPTLRAMRETPHQNTEPFVADDTDTRELLGETHTPLEETAADIVAARGGKATRVGLFAGGWACLPGADGFDSGRLFPTIRLSQLRKRRALTCRLNRL